MNNSIFSQWEENNIATIESAIQKNASVIEEFMEALNTAIQQAKFSEVSYLTDNINILSVKQEILLGIRKHIMQGLLESTSEPTKEEYIEAFMQYLMYEIGMTTNPASVSTAVYANRHAEIKQALLLNSISHANNMRNN